MDGWMDTSFPHPQKVSFSPECKQSQGPFQDRKQSLQSNSMFPLRVWNLGMWKSGAFQIQLLVARPHGQL